MRHTVRRVASARYADLSPDRWGRGYPIQSWMGGYPISLDDGGVPHPVLTMGGGTPSSLGWGTFSPPPRQQDGVPPAQTWDGIPPHLDLGMGYPLPLSGPGMRLPPPLPRKCGQTENITFPHHSDAGGNKFTYICR